MPPGACLWCRYADIQPEHVFAEKLKGDHLRGAGLIVFRYTHEAPQVLLMQKDRLSVGFPKCCVDNTEYAFELALREWTEETNYTPDDIVIHTDSILLDKNLVHYFTAVCSDYAIPLDQSWRLIALEKREHNPVIKAWWSTVDEALRGAKLSRERKKLLMRAAESAYLIHERRNLIPKVPNLCHPSHGVT